MNNLFSIFDPSSSFGLIPNWAAALLFISTLPPVFWASPSRLNVPVILASEAMKSELKAVASKLASPGILLLPVSLFFVLLMNNVMGLMPYVFTSSSHLSFTAALALPVWLGCSLQATLKSEALVTAHLVPLGSPAALAPLMVIIELTSFLIRPLTLSVRLAANMVAGHLLLCLLSSPMPSMGWGAWAGCTLPLLILILLESAVAVIQAFVFTLLSSLYSQELESPFM